MSPEITESALTKLENYLISAKSWIDSDDLPFTKEAALKLISTARSLIIYAKGKYEDLRINHTTFDLKALDRLYLMDDTALWKSLSQEFYIIGASAHVESGTGDLLLFLLQEYNKERDQLY